MKDPNYYRSTVHKPQNIATCINMVFDEITEMDRFCPYPVCFSKAKSYHIPTVEAEFDGISKACKTGGKRPAGLTLSSKLFELVPMLNEI